MYKYEGSKCNLPKPTLELSFLLRIYSVSLAKNNHDNTTKTLKNLLIARASTLHPPHHLFLLFLKKEETKYNCN